MPLSQWDISVKDDPASIIKELCAASAPYERRAGLYFLFGDEKLLYIGQSRDVFWRIGGHAVVRDGKNGADLGVPFNRVVWAPCDDSERRHNLEREFIMILKPSHNFKRNRHLLEKGRKTKAQITEQNRIRRLAKRRSERAARNQATD